MDAKLSHEMRMRMINLVCTVAWSDFELSDSERRHVLDLCARFDMSHEDQEQVLTWLASPPSSDELADPGKVPPEHRDAFLQECQRMVMADGYVDPEESMSYRLLRDILTPTGSDS